MEQTKKPLSREELLGKGDIHALMMKFAIPSIIAMLVGAVYNIVDQIFIGRYVGTLGNAATNIAFPLTMSCTAIGLLFGIGGAANFNLHMGRKDYEKAPYFIGNSLTMLICLGTLLTVITELFLRPMLMFFGSPADVLPYAMEYVRITAIGFPFLILTTGGGHLIRADGSPNMTMICSLSGAIINTVLDALFVITFGWGMFGAALATVIGQVFSGILVLNYMRSFKTLKLEKIHLIPNVKIVLQTASLGVASCVNQFAMMVMQIILNNSMKHYGALSVYGDSIPIACAGIATKVNQLFFSIVIGIAQGSQPIESFNYGAKQYKRVRDTYMLALKAAFVASIVAFLLFQTIPEKLLAFFGSGSPEYVDFGVRFFRIFLFCTWANCIQPATSQFFASVGKPLRGMFVSLTRQIIFLIPLLLILPLFSGITGILYAGPIADFMAAITAAVMVWIEFKDMKRLETFA
ncbi:MAG: MATE family efflux transporter [Clostridiales bacterium]|nr:MATE family efflux transporter [Candidatus Blautia equi]